ncbi:GNAT family N-acetyltransferase [Fictibacillus phosphorivorans]|uniref:GNAT family N-acetyltransferase n=1 Tax=Fictibacillus phosphorivorans TaxID=1221500 RepID=UPI001293546C|nr:GNAT family N-acetyltransferase [Fictibacillus phosphorivorans]MQR94574.1 N-acetyltransferase [Fictibacillus phosphorivorans]
MIEHPMIETDRLILRKVTLDDAKEMFDYLSDSEVVKHMGIAPYQTVEAVHEEVEWYHSILKEQTGIRWGITLKNSDKVIGSCGFLNRNGKHFRTEVGFELNKEYWGKGVAREALEAVVTFGFKHMKLERIEALIEPGNISSQNLVEKIGFVKEGLLRHYEYTCGKFDDLFIYSLLKSDKINRKSEH